jgi:hypothetical protein
MGIILSDWEGMLEEFIPDGFYFPKFRSFGNSVMGYVGSVL